VRVFVFCETENDSCWRGGTQIHILLGGKNKYVAQKLEGVSKNDAIVASEINESVRYAMKQNMDSCQNQKGHREGGKNTFCRESDIQSSMQTDPEIREPAKFEYMKDDQ
jgi:hypothetical protein